MTKIVALFALSFFALPVLAQQKPCEELKSEIAKKLEARNVKNYQLDIVGAGDIKDQKVVGSCEGGKKKITYRKG
jgi:hypothetical protein